MSSAEPWQVLSDCPHCLTESAVVETLDPLHPASRLGVPVELACRLCGWTQIVAEGAETVGCDRCEPRDGTVGCATCGYVPRPIETVAPRDLTDPARAHDALVRWSVAEGEADLEVFCQGNLGGGSAEIVERLVRREAISTTFDVIAFLFPGAGGGGGGGGQRAVEAIRVRVEAEVAARPVAEVPFVDPRTAARVLVSVMVADGSLRSGERAFVARFLEREGLDPMAPEDLRVWRPGELGAPPNVATRERILEAAIHLMHLDRERDGSEWSVIRTFARAWAIPEERLEAWDRTYDRRYRGAMARLGRLVNGWFA